MFVQEIDAHTSRPRNDGRKSRQAQAAFKELDCFVANAAKLRINDHVEGNWLPFALGQQFRRNIFVILGAVFDYGQLQVDADLRRCKAHSRSVAHGISHVPNESLKFMAGDRIRREQASLFPQHRFTDLYDFQAHVK